MSPGTYIFQRPFLRGLCSKGSIDGGKFAFQDRLGYPHSWNEIIRRGHLTEGFLRYEFGGLYLEGLIHGGAHFRNFSVW